MSTLSTHVLDLTRGGPARDVAVVLEAILGGAHQELFRGNTDADGRIRPLGPSAGTVLPGTYRLTFDTAGYFAALGQASFYPHVAITFEVRAEDEHFHVPLLLSPYGFSTYRGS
jgi:5-hydroxyisourate hydrolase